MKDTPHQAAEPNPNTEPTPASHEPGAQEQGIVHNCTGGEPLGVNWWRLRQIEAKVERYIAHTYSLHVSAQEASRILAYHLEKNEKRRRGRDKVIHQSGARRNWKKRITEGIAEGMEAGTIKGERSKGGTALSLTERALQIERAYNARFDELLAEFSPKRV